MKIIADATGGLTDEGAAEADQILSQAAPGLTPGQLRAVARRAAMMIDPEAAKERKKDAAKRGPGGEIPGVRRDRGVVRTGLA
jgi:hypothetical protein